MKHLYLLIATTLVLSGCALTRDHITLDYVPMPSAEKIAEADKIPLKVKISDQRNSKDRVSCKKNGYGMEMASILSKNDVNLLIKEALVTELANRGFSLGNENLNSVLIDVELNKFYNDFKVQFFAGRAVAEVILNIKVKKPDGQFTFSKSVIGAGENQGIFLFTGRNAKITLEDALQNAISKIVSDQDFIQALLK